MPVREAVRVDVSVAVTVALGRPLVLGTGDHLADRRRVLADLLRDLRRRQALALHLEHVALPVGAVVHRGGHPRRGMPKSSVVARPYCSSTCAALSRSPGAGRTPPASDG